MRIVKEKFLKEAALEYPRAAEALKTLTQLFKAAQWQTPVEMKQAIPNIDPTVVKSGHTVYIVNVRRNEFRLVIAVHFDRQFIYTLRFLTHAEYDLNQWKQQL